MQQSSKALKQMRLAVIFRTLSSVAHLLFVSGVSSILKNQKPGAPTLILISGCTGTGKSTFGMEVAMNLGILKCISTDTIRQVMRTFKSEPALMRSSFEGIGDPVNDWLECCEVLKTGVENIIDDSMNRGTSLILEGVHIIPSSQLLKKWEDAGGVSIGCVLTIPEPEVHAAVIERRGQLTGKGASKQAKHIPRIRAIHDEMLRLGQLNNWVIIEQRPRLTPSPIAILQEGLENRYFQGTFEAS